MPEELAWPERYGTVQSRRKQQNWNLLTTDDNWQLLTTVKDICTSRNVHPYFYIPLTCPQHLCNSFFACVPVSPRCGRSLPGFYPDSTLYCWPTARCLGPAAASAGLSPNAATWARRSQKVFRNPLKQLWIKPVKSEDLSVFCLPVFATTDEQ